MEFVELERITGEAIGNAVIKFYNGTGVEVTEYRGQCYDGAADMQSQKKGAEPYFLSCSHNLNLSLALSCKHPEIDNILKTYKAITILFNSYPKQELLLEYIPAVLELKNVKCW